MKLLNSLGLWVLMIPTVAAAQGNEPPPPSGLEAAGLMPPDPMQRDPYAAPSQTEQELAESDRKDSGRGLEFFWLNVEGGGEQVGLETFDAGNLVDAQLVKTQHFGALFGAGLGLRLLFLTLGPRFRIGRFESFDLWTINGEFGLHIPIGIVEPYLTLGGGYAFLSTLGPGGSSAALDMNAVSIRGWDLRTGFGLDIYLTHVVSVGANLTGELLMLTRPGVDPQDLRRAASANVSTQEEAAQAAEDIYAADGSSIGGGVSLTAVVGLHF